MATLDEIFVREFTKMMQERKAITGVRNLSDIPLPPEAINFKVENHDKVVIRGINDEYFGKLNEKEHSLWSKGALYKRKYDYKGEFIRDKKTGDYVYEQVTCPQDCVAIISDIQLQVPLKYKPSETFIYVDYKSRQNPITGGTDIKYVYIIPKKYCYKMQQTALVLSWNRLRVYFSGVQISLVNGHTLYMYSIPYKPTKTDRNYRVLHCKTSEDYTQEIKAISQYWIRTGIMFNPAICTVDFIKGRDNMAYMQLNGVLDTYERFNADVSMDKTVDSMIDDGEDNYEYKF